MEPFVDHIEVTVRNMRTAVPFYDRMLPLLGFDLARRSEAVIEQHEKHVVTYEHPRMGFSITSPLGAFAGESINRRKPGALHHLAFRASSRAEVDRLHHDLKAIGAVIVSPPREYPEYTPAGYYALFFKDPEGIKYELVCMPDAAAPEAPVRELVKDFLSLIWRGRGSTQENESALERLLDELALARHDLDFSFDDTDYPDPPRPSEEELRQAVCERFPDFGMYNVALQISDKVGSAELGVGDAIDDLVDIAQDLSAVDWAWSQTSQADALWHFTESFDKHWGKHLRDLQLYLFCLKNGW